MSVLLSQDVPVIYGVGAVKEVGSKMKELGCTKVLCVYDAGVKAAGLANVVIKSLEDEGLGVAIFDKALPNPPDVSSDEGGELARKEKVDGIVAIGGGSAMDTAKAINVVAVNPGKTKDYFYWSYPGSRVNDYDERCLPLICIPTTAGTGAEVGYDGVITDTEHNHKDMVRCIVDYAIIDPEMTKTMPPAVTAATGLDALAHSVEGMTTVLVTPQSDLYNVDAIGKIMNNLLIAYKDGNNIAAREAMSLAAVYAGFSLNSAALHLGHAIGHNLTSQFNIPHGIACSLGLPAIMKLTAQAAPGRVKMVGEAMGIEYDANVSNEKAAEMVSEKIADLMKKLNIKSLKEYGVSKEDAIGVSKIVIDAEQSFIECGPVQNVDLKVMEKLMADIYDSYQ